MKHIYWWCIGILFLILILIYMFFYYKSPVIVVPEIPDNSPSDSSIEEPGEEKIGKFVGKYYEDADTNPEDPMPGDIKMTISQDGTFEATLQFSFIGCQSYSVGKVVGTLEGDKLFGTWSGPVDNTQQSGEFIGYYKDDQYEGTYTVDGGKQKIVVEDCVEYYIAPKGTWYLKKKSN